MNNKQKEVIGFGCVTAIALLFGFIGITVWELRVFLGIVDGPPCLNYDHREVQPLIVGQTTKLKIGSTDDPSGCIVRNSTQSEKEWVWSSDNAGVVQVSLDGIVTGIAPGKFSVFAKKGGEETLSMSGIVYPPDWTLRILPEVATVRVGDRITFKMFVSDSKGRLLPPVTYFRFSTTDYQQPIPGAPSKSPNLEPLLAQTQSAGTFQALRPGTVTITGAMGDRTSQAKLTIK
ncbi:Ig-like domain-containing protein [Lyngbya sp. CCAP 1446/10]|uniref:Ig-like domain-containing protein n=1 Tax=Lyngbya sp. CCAP 1446/10 TaxID=439293 RepID=UPI002237B899|nr:Ig-like domain-containing protein [Lyngbya sp. CCAP 1446/10]MCW6052933.1 Ig-like domain-containing protein [Lyngbya sp. CCAP 1446/10]